MQRKYSAKTVEIITVALLLCNLFLPIKTAYAVDPVPFQLKVSKNGIVVTQDMTLKLCLWTRNTYQTSDYDTNFNANTADANYFWCGTYNFTPTVTGVGTVQLGEAPYAFPATFPNSRLYYDLFLKYVSEPVTSFDRQIPPDEKRHVLSATLEARMSNLETGLGGVSSQDLWIYDSTTGAFEGVTSLDMSANNLKLHFGNNLNKKILAEWKNANNWWEVSEIWNFPSGKLFYKGANIETYFGGVGSGVAIFVGATTATTDGNIGGYIAADAMCNAQYTGSHMCTSEEILNTISSNPVLLAGITGYMKKAAPGFTANANDCNGWQSNNAVGYYGAYYMHDALGGQFWLNTCNQPRQVLCCK